MNEKTKNEEVLDREIHLGMLIRFALPTILSTVFMSIYSSVDGMFVARLVNTDALSAVNIVMPMIFISSGIGMMFGSGGNALVAKKLGERKEQEAREDFSLLLVVAFVASLVIVGLCAVFLKPLLHLLGADDRLMAYCVPYMIPVLISMPFTIFGTIFSMSYITVGKANLGLAMSVLGGVLNIVLDWLFIAVFHMGITGAAVATSIGYASTSVIGLIYFIVCRKHDLYVVRPKWRSRTIIQSCANGSSEMIGVFAGSIVEILFNNILMRLAGADGVASLTIMLYVQSLFNAVYRGYATGIAPVISYNYGAANQDRLKKIHQISTRMIIAASVALTAVCFIFAPVMVRFFAGKNQGVYEMALHGFRIFATSCLLVGINVYASALFTALNDEKTSAILSFCRAVVFLVIPILVLPPLIELDGVWMAIPVGEVLSILMSGYYFRKLHFEYRNPGGNGTEYKG